MSTASARSAENEERQVRAAAAFDEAGFSANDLFAGTDAAYDRTWPCLAERVAQKQGNALASRKMRNSVSISNITSRIENNMLCVGDASMRNKQVV